MNKNFRRILASASVTASIAISITLSIAPSAGAVMPPNTTEPNPVTTTTSTPPTGAARALRGAGLSATLSARVTDTVSVGGVERLWCVTGGEGEYRIRSLRVTSAIHPNDRGKAVPEGSFGFPGYTVVQARVSYCGRSVEGLTEYPVSVEGLRIDIEGTPITFRGAMSGLGVRRNVVQNWSSNPTVFEGPVGPGITSLPSGYYTLAAVATKVPAPKATMPYTVSLPR